MEENQDKILNNPFFTRGCSRTPEPYSEEAIFRNSCAKLDCRNWLGDITGPESFSSADIVEIRFKNSRKDFFRAPAEMKLEIGDFVAVESSPGHDIGIVSLAGELARLQMKKKRYKYPLDDLKKVYRRARAADIEKWLHAVVHEDSALKKTKEIIRGQKLDMKMNDVEYQGDNTKAIFYYTADDRVDFRELIKVLAEVFRIRIEMKQIGARQEAARLGGIGSCGRELCCATWLTNFRSVTTKNARVQQLSLNPQKLAGQCGKLKCCLNFEQDVYLEALKSFPPQDTVLQTKKGQVEFQKADVFKKIVWYSYKSDYASMMAIPIEKAWEIIKLNRNGKVPDKLEDYAEKQEQKTEYNQGLTEEDLTRFDD